MKKSGEDVPSWMLELKSCDSKDWKKLEKKPTVRKIINSQPKANIPKKFLKHLEKNMKRRGRFMP